MTNPSRRYYDEPFLNPKVSISLAAGISESTRKSQLFDQVKLCLQAQRQISRRQNILSYAGQNYTEAALAAVRV
ncbi:MAG: hypothetical protein ACD_55C00120G0001 [uncultured bacterium]|uniref:Uncharacterized protein n=1 Tax=Citrifermentans bemidjiense (strain ATCC BAA-1014 / DSM 16622 / JCM 12645 / Bem) TaxID=404380 RepID=B5EC31_CITBB|nr:hypothetical protein [Citrifermentans bemidjiense]ACH40487.1 hypothetical protein Gbem_3494 [Citrifermentans bemidjiense Bem]EKD59182.1 MAG: hypothetical protein ACD_55C00120G0001 [uncultured bacterium]